MSTLSHSENGSQRLTIAFPVYNEGELLTEFLLELDRVCGGIPDYYVDCLIADDGSTDNVSAHVRAATFKSVKAIRILHLSTNVGHSFAIQCLIDHIEAPVSILMDADFQDDPDLIPQLLDIHHRTGAEVVRVARNDQAGPWISRFLFNGFRKLYRWASGEKQAFGTYGLYSKTAIHNLRGFGTETHRYFPGLVRLVGLKTEVIAIRRKERRRGESRMGWMRLFRLAFDALFSFSTFPIRAASVMGFIITSASLLAIGVIVYIRLFTPLAIPGWSSILTGIAFFGGIQLMFLGILGEYIARIFEQVKHRPHYFIASTEVVEVGSSRAPITS